MSRRGETLDTSVLVPALLPWHEHHALARAGARRVRAVPAHALVETYSVLTRLPSPHRLAPQTAAELVARLPYEPLGLSPAGHLEVIRVLATAGIKGGATYDGLVAATAAEHALRLLSLDRRAIPTYEAVGADVHSP